MSSMSVGKRSAKHVTGGPAGARATFVVAGAPPVALGVLDVPDVPAGDAASIGRGGAAGKPAGARRLQPALAVSTATNEPANAIAKTPLKFSADFTARQCQQTAQSAKRQQACWRQLGWQASAVQFAMWRSVIQYSCLVSLSSRLAIGLQWVPNVRSIQNLRVSLSSAAAVLAVLAAGCAEQTVETPGPLDRAAVERKIFPVRAPRAYDILFVVDNSPTMQNLQPLLAANAARFSDTLRGFGGFPLDLNIGVISTDVGTAGGAPAAGCSSWGDAGAFFTGGVDISDGSSFLREMPDPLHLGQRITNYRGTLTEAFTKMFALPTTTCRYPQSLRAISRALLQADPSSPAASFVRRDAILSIVIISANDDCSLAPRVLSQFLPDNEDAAYRCFSQSVQCAESTALLGPHHVCVPLDTDGEVNGSDLYHSLFQLKNGDGLGKYKLNVSVVTGPSDVATIVQPNAASGHVVEPSCGYQVAATGSIVLGRPAVRTNTFAQLFRSGIGVSICGEDWSDPLWQLGVGFDDPLGTPCFDGKIVQPLDCSVREHRYFQSPRQSTIAVPYCDATESSTPCYRMSTDLVKCPAPAPGWIVDVVRGPNQVLPGTVDEIECAVAP